MRFCLYVSVFMGIALADPPPSPPTASHRRPLLAAQVSPVTRTDPRSGQSVRTVVIVPRIVQSRTVTPQVVSPEATAPVLDGGEVRSLVEEMARKHDVNPALVESVIKVESNFNSRAVSPKGAQGLMQLMPDTARRFGVQNSFDPRQNIEGGVKYLKFLQQTFKDERLAIAAYNAGEGAVSKYGNVPPYAETLDYVTKVGKRYGDAKRQNEAGNKRVADAKAEADAAPKGPVYRHLQQVVDSEGKVYLTTQ